MISLFYGFISEKTQYDLICLGLDSNEKKLAFSLQNYLHINNDDRTKALRAGTYKNPFDQTEAVQYLKAIFMLAIDKEKKELCDKIDSKYNRDPLDNKIAVFAITNDIEEAAGALKGAYIGRNVSQFAYILQADNYPLPIEKIQLLVDGYYFANKKIINGKTYEHIHINMYNDKDVINWNASKKNCYRWWFRYRNHLTKDEWELVFANCNHKLDKWYAKYTQDKIKKNQIMYGRANTYHI